MIAYYSRSFQMKQLYYLMKLLNNSNLVGKWFGSANPFGIIPMDREDKILCMKQKTYELGRNIECFL